MVELGHFENLVGFLDSCMRATDVGDEKLCSENTGWHVNHKQMLDAGSTQGIP
jgi:hypothetical protein